MPTGYKPKEAVYWPKHSLLKIIASKNNVEITNFSIKSMECGRLAIESKKYF